MAEDVRVTNMPDSGSNEMVAMKMWQMLREHGADLDVDLSLYSKCLEATYRNGKYAQMAFPR